MNLFIENLSLHLDAFLTAAGVGGGLEIQFVTNTTP